MNCIIPLFTDKWIYTVDARNCGKIHTILYPNRISNGINTFLRSQPNISQYLQTHCCYISKTLNMVCTQSIHSSHSTILYLHIVRAKNLLWTLWPYMEQWRKTTTPHLFCHCSVIRVFALVLVLLRVVWWKTTTPHLFYHCSVVRVFCPSPVKSSIQYLIPSSMLHTLS